MKKTTTDTEQVKAEDKPKAKLKPKSKPKAPTKASAKKASKADTVDAKKEHKGISDVISALISNESDIKAGEEVALKDACEKKDRLRLKVAVAALALFFASLLVTCFVKKTGITPSKAKSSTMVKTFFEDVKIKGSRKTFARGAIMGEKPDTQLAAYLKNTVAVGDTIVEVSHGIGLYALLMAKLSEPSGHVHVFNPSSEHADFIEANTEKNGAQHRIIVKTLGISDHTYNGLLIHKKNRPVISGSLQEAGHDIPMGFNAIPVSVSSLDEQLPMTQSVNILKINTNGGEGAVIGGATDLISKSSNIVIIISFNENSFSGYDAIEKLIINGFQLYLIQDEGKLIPALISDLNKIKNGYLVLKRGE